MQGLLLAVVLRGVAVSLLLLLPVPVPPAAPEVVGVVTVRLLDLRALIHVRGPEVDVRLRPQSRIVWGRGRWWGPTRRSFPRTWANCIPCRPTMNPPNLSSFYASFSTYGDSLHWGYISFYGLSCRSPYALSYPRYSYLSGHPLGV